VFSEEAAGGLAVALFEGVDYLEVGHGVVFDAALVLGEVDAGLEFEAEVLPFA